MRDFLTKVITVFRNASGNLRLISWQINADGSISRLADSGELTEKISLVSAVSDGGDRVITAVRAGDRGLKSERYLFF